jgi:nucleotide-binding universal stress UspA family protein
MLQRIMVPLDCSPRAELILRQVAPLLKTGGAELLLAHCDSAFSPEVERFDTPLIPENKRDDAEAYLRRIARRCQAAGAKVRTRVLHGSPAGSLLNLAKQEGMTMIAMTTHGRTGILRWLMGSVADTIVRASEVPVLLIRPSEAPDRLSFESTASGDIPFRRILIAADGSPTSMAAVEPAMRIASHFDSEIVALHVWDSYVLDGTPLLGMEAGMPPPAEAPLSSEDEVTALVARQLGPSRLKVTRVTRYGEPSAEILDHCFEHRVDLIALAIHERGRLSRWLTGSVAERVLRSAGIPMLIVRAAPKPELVSH